MKNVLVVFALALSSSVALFCQAASQKQNPTRLRVISGNLGAATNLYNPAAFADVAGAQCISPGIFPAMPFTPKSNSHASQVGIPLGWAAGTNQVNVSIYDDASGVPGTVIAGPTTVTNVPLWGTCCTLPVANFSPVALNAGSQYWIVVTSDGDFCGTWAYVSRPPFIIAYNFGNGWQAQANDIIELAGEVLGTIP